MFHFLEARMATMLRTSRSLLRVTQRHLHRLIEKKEKLEQEGLPALKESAGRGDVDAVKELTKKDLDELSKEIDELTNLERNTFIAEYRAVKEVVPIQEGFERAIHTLHRINEKMGHQFPILGKIIDEFATMRNELLRDEKIEEQEMYNQYLPVNRQMRHEKGVTQTLVVSVSNIKTLIDRIRELRGEVGKEKHEEKELEKEGSKVLNLLNAINSEKDEKKLETLLKELENEEKQIHGELAKFTRLFKESERAFTIVIKVCVEIYFQYEKDEEFFKEFFKQLEEAKFPEHDLEELNKLLRTEQEDERQHLGDIFAIVKRGSRIERSQLEA